MALSSVDLPAPFGADDGQPARRAATVRRSDVRTSTSAASPEPGSIRARTAAVVSGRMARRARAGHVSTRLVTRSTATKNGAPTKAVTTPMGSSAGASTVRAIRSARTRKAAPPISESGSTIR